MDRYKDFITPQQPARTLEGAAVAQEASGGRRALRARRGARRRTVPHKHPPLCLLSTRHGGDSQLNNSGAQSHPDRQACRSNRFSDRRQPSPGRARPPVWGGRQHPKSSMALRPPGSYPHLTVSTQHREASVPEGQEWACEVGNSPQHGHGCCGHGRATGTLLGRLLGVGVRLCREVL